MKVSVRGHRFDVTEPLDAYTRRRLRFAVGAFESRIDDIVVRMADVNGVRGGVDKRCQISVRLPPVGVLVARATDANAYNAVDLAAARLRIVLVRRLQRLRRYDGR